MQSLNILPSPSALVSRSPYQLLTLFPWKGWQSSLWRSPRGTALVPCRQNRKSSCLSWSTSTATLHANPKFAPMTLPLTPPEKLYVQCTLTSTLGLLIFFRQVVLTGATGSLGSYVLDELLADPNVGTIYCLCRAKNDAEAADRLATSMKTRKLLKRFSAANASQRIVALAADLPAYELGLDEARYRELACRATVIIHVRSSSYPRSSS